MFSIDGGLLPAIALADTASFLEMLNNDEIAKSLAGDVAFNPRVDGRRSIIRKVVLPLADHKPRESQLNQQRVDRTEGLLPLACNGVAEYLTRVPEP